MAAAADKSTDKSADKSNDKKKALDTSLAQL